MIRCGPAGPLIQYGRSSAIGKSQRNRGSRRLPSPASRLLIDVPPRFVPSEADAARSLRYGTRIAFGNFRRARRLPTCPCARPIFRLWLGDIPNRPPSWRRPTSGFRFRRRRRTPNTVAGSLRLTKRSATAARNRRAKPYSNIDSIIGVAFAPARACAPQYVGQKRLRRAGHRAKCCFRRLLRN